MSQYQHVQHPHATHTNTDTHNLLKLSSRFHLALVIYFVLHNYVLRLNSLAFGTKDTCTSDHVDYLISAIHFIATCLRSILGKTV